MVVDDSFKKTGAIPFKWEAQPGVSKFKCHDNHEPPLSSTLTRSASTLSKPSKELQTQWLHSMSLSSDTKNSTYSSVNTFFSWLRSKWRQKKTVDKPKLKLTLELDPECSKDYTFYLEKLVRWSLSSSHMSSSSSFSSHIQGSSPPLRRDDETGQSRVSNNLSRFLRRPKMISMEAKGREKKVINISVYVADNKE